MGYLKHDIESVGSVMKAYVRKKIALPTPTNYEGIDNFVLMTSNIQEVLAEV